MLRVVVPAVLLGGFLIPFVWMGFALGAVLKKLGAPAVHAWIPVQRWIAAARAGRASTLTVAIARGTALLGALLAIGSYTGLVLMASTDAENALTITALAGMLLWLAGSLTGWVLWIYGAGTIQMRMRAPRGLSWVAALWPVVWASIMGWGKYRAIGGGAAGAPAYAASAPAPASAPGAPAPTSAPLPTRTAPTSGAVPHGVTDGMPPAPTAPATSSAPEPPTPAPATPSPTPIRGQTPEPSPVNKSPFAALTPEALRPDTVDNSGPGPAPAASPPVAASVPPVSASAPPAPGSATPAPAATPELPASASDLPPSPAPSAASTPPPSEVSPYVSKLSPYLATPPESAPSQLTPYGNPSPPTVNDAVTLPAPSEPTSAGSAPPPHTESAPAASLNSWVERMQEAHAPKREAEAPDVAAPAEKPVEPPAAPSPPAPAPTPPPAGPVAASSPVASSGVPSPPSAPPLVPTPPPAVPTVPMAAPTATNPTTTCPRLDGRTHGRIGRRAGNLCPAALATVAGHNCGAHCRGRRRSRRARRSRGRPHHRGP